MGVVAKVALLHVKLFTDADQSSVSCKRVISSKWYAIQCILGTITKLHILICSFELTYLMEDRVSHKAQKNSHVIYLDSHLVTFCLIPHNKYMYL